MNERPQLTVAVPTYNGTRHLSDALRSIFEQRVAGVRFDLLICDDQSDDGSIDLTRKLVGDNARIESNPERLGLARNWNRCVELSDTPLVAIFHQDDVMRSGHLEGHLAEFADQEVGLVASAADVIDESGREVPASIVARGGFGPIPHVYNPSEALPHMVEANPLRCSAVTLRKAAFDAVGKFDPSYRYVVDWEFWLRVASTWKVAWLPQATVSIRWHLASETHRFKSSTEDLEETRRLLDSLDLSSIAGWRSLRRQAKQRLARAYLNRAYDAGSHRDRELTRRCLGSAWRLDPGSWSLMLKDPRFAGLMAKVLFLPNSSAPKSF